MPHDPSLAQPVRPPTPRAGAPAARAALEVHDLTVAYRRTPVLLDVDLEIPCGSMTAIVGPNGAGKSTLLKAALGLVPAATGAVRLFGKTLRAVRRSVAYVPQRESVDWEFPVSVLEVALMGRYGHLGWLRRPGARDRAIAMEALETMGIADLAGRQIGELSGGQQQRTFLARALAQQAELYLMDEPSAGVDAATERAIVDVLRRLRDQGRTVVAVHHDLSTVMAWFDRVVLLNVRVVAAGPAAATLTAETLAKTYGGRLTLLEEAAAVMRRAGA
ncbi:MAG TPA: metal ABC transporter ATP-binding protein [Phycisphaerales bacterium]|nr:metal ABC transporter ATP-binding protein [Phycisphaerales bacterium]HMP38461.1 metal ABC transporter ATP-binding protein [Phycisphaerales bacterium]